MAAGAFLGVGEAALVQLRLRRYRLPVKDGELRVDAVAMCRVCYGSVDGVNPGPGRRASDGDWR